MVSKTVKFCKIEIESAAFGKFFCLCSPTVGFCYEPNGLPTEYISRWYCTEDLPDLFGYCDFNDALNHIRYNISDRFAVLFRDETDETLRSAEAHYRETALEYAKDDIVACTSATDGHTVFTPIPDPKLVRLTWIDCVFDFPDDT